MSFLYMIPAYNHVAPSPLTHIDTILQNEWQISQEVKMCSHRVPRKRVHTATSQEGETGRKTDKQMGK